MKEKAIDLFFRGVALYFWGLILVLPVVWVLVFISIIIAITGA